GFWPRAMALVIDVVGFLIVTTFLGNVVGLTHFPTITLVPFYLIAMHSLMGWTIGKRLLRLRVADRLGKKLSFGQATLRFLASAWCPILMAIAAAIFRLANIDIEISVKQLLSGSRHMWPAIFALLAMGTTFVAYLAGLVMAAFHPQKRALHDLLSGSYVTYK